MKDWIKITLWHNKGIVDCLSAFYTTIFETLEMDWEGEAIEGKKYLMDQARRQSSYYTKTEEKIITVLTQNRWLNILNINQDRRIKAGLPKLSKDELINILTHSTWGEIFQKIRSIE